MANAYPESDTYSESSDSDQENYTSTNNLWQYLSTKKFFNYIMRHKTILGHMGQRFVNNVIFSKGLLYVVSCNINWTSNGLYFNFSIKDSTTQSLLYELHLSFHTDPSFGSSPTHLKYNVPRDVKTQLGIPRVPYVDYNIQIVDIDKTYQNDVTLIPTTNGDFNNIDDLIQWYYYNIDNRIDIYIHKLICDTIIFFIEQLIFSAFQNIDKVINPIPLRRGSNPLGNSSQII
jgi:hypothetical protein